MVVRDYMTAKVFTVRHDKKLIVVQEIMNWGRLRHVPVVDQHNRLVGVISHRDLLHASISSAVQAPDIERQRHLWTVPIDQVMHTDVQTISPDAPVQEAARLMRASKIGCLPVVSQGKLVGIISEYDLLGIVAQLA